jgi:hypothetical protein
MQRYWYRCVPFGVNQINLHRSELCDYCFYGGPGGERPSL